MSSGEFDRALAHAAVVSPTHVLHVKVDCSNVAPGDQGLYRNALSGAFHMWESALGQKVFEATEVGDTEISLHFRRDVTDRGVELCGRSQWRRGVMNPATDPTVVFTADVQVRMYKPNGDVLSFEQLRACIAHELGHVLGLDDSPVAGDIMGRMDFNHPASSIRPEEVEQLVRAREEAVQIRRNLLSRSIRARN